MDREPEDLQSLSFTGIFKEAFKIFRSRAKLLEWLALSLVLPLSFAILWGRLVIRYVLSHWNAMPTLMETTSPAGQGITKERAELLILMAVYAIFVLGFSLMSAASAVYTMASIYASKEISYACVMSIVVRALKRLALIFLAFFVLVFFQFACTVVFFNMDLAVYEFGEYVITAFVVCGYLSLGMVRYLACVSTMPEDKSGVRPIRKSRDLNKGQRTMAFSLDILYLLSVGIIGWVFAYAVLNGDRHGVGSAAKAVYCTVLVGLLSFVHLMGLLTQSVFYFVCKSYHHESIDKSSLSDDLEGNLGEYEPLKSSDSQLENHVHASIV